MSKKRLIIVIIILVILGAVFVCLISINQEKFNSERAVSWNEAIEILNDGEIKEIFQAHNLSVILILKDGTNINTKEPSIDDIFEEVEKCGNPCGKIILSTE